MPFSSYLYKNDTQLCIHACTLLCLLGSVFTDGSNVDLTFSFPHTSELEVFVYACAINILSFAILIWYFAFLVSDPFHPFCTVSWYWCTGICDLYRKDRPNLACIFRDSFFHHHHEVKSFDSFVRNTSMDQGGGRVWW